MDDLATSVMSDEDVDALMTRDRTISKYLAESYMDLLLLNRFVGLVKARLQKMADRDLDAVRRNDVSM